MSGADHHRWEQIGERDDRLLWRCVKCALVVNTLTTATTPRADRDNLRVGGWRVTLMPSCGHAVPRRYPRRHIWTVTAAAEDRALWRCARCRVEVETTISATHPSGVGGLKYARRPGDQWEQLNGRAPRCV